MKATGFLFDYQWTAASPFTDDAGTHILVSILGSDGSVIDGPMTAASLFTISGRCVYTGDCYGFMLEHTDAGNEGPDHYSLLRLDVTIPNCVSEPGPSGAKYDDTYSYFYPVTTGASGTPVYDQPVPDVFAPFEFQSDCYYTWLAAARTAPTGGDQQLVTGAAVTMSAAWQAANPTRPTTQPLGPITIRFGGVAEATVATPRSGRNPRLRQRQTPYIRK